MRRMTIFRSELISAAAIAALAAGLQAQQPPAVQRPISQAQRAADQAGQSGQATAQDQSRQQPVQITQSSGQGTVPVGQTPASHTVVQGETLWGLAQQYLGDPLLWPEIYRLNTNVVEDPHWIYPGEELRLTPDATQEQPATTTTVTEVAPTPATQDSTVVVSQNMTVTPSAMATDTAQQMAQGPAPNMNGPTVFASMGVRRTQNFQVAGQRAYRAVREGEYYGAGFLTENQRINSGHIVANVETSTRGAIRTRTSALVYEDVVVQPPSGEALQVGDLLLSYFRGDEVGQYGEMINPTGLLRVKSQNGGMWVATLIRVFAPVNDNQEIIKIQPFVNNSSERAQPVVGGVEGNVLIVRNNADVAQLQNAVFIDKGANQGLHLGDILQLYMLRADSATSSTLEQDQGRAIVVNTRAGTATAVIVELYRGDISGASKFRQVRRMPS